MLYRDSLVAVLIGLLTWSLIGPVDAEDGAGLVGSIQPTRSSPTDLEVTGPFPSGRTNGFIPRWPARRRPCIGGFRSSNSDRSWA
jgi:hypothetical protein